MVLRGLQAFLRAVSGVFEVVPGVLEGLKRATVLEVVSWVPEEA